MRWGGSVSRVLFIGIDTVHVTENSHPVNIGRHKFSRQSWVLLLDDC
jgi:hypothetical protein